MLTPEDFATYGWVSKPVFGKGWMQRNDEYFSYQGFYNSESVITVWDDFSKKVHTRKITTVNDVEELNKLLWRIGIRRSVLEIPGFPVDLNFNIPLREESNTVAQKDAEDYFNEPATPINTIEEYSTWQRHWNNLPPERKVVREGIIKTDENTPNFFTELFNKKEDGKQ